MNATAGVRAFLLVLLALTLSGCASRRWYNDYRPPAEINGYEFGSPVTLQPETLQLVNGEGFEFWLVNEKAQFDVNYVDYFNPEDKSPFAAPARVSSIEYLYCTFGDRPGLCGGKVVYESEEAYMDEGFLAKIEKTNHERIIDELVARHGRPQIAEKYSQTIIKDEKETYRGPVNPMQLRVWCDFSKGVPKRCNRSIVASFHARKGRGVIIYMDDRVYRYAKLFGARLKHQHPLMEVITGKNRILSEKEKIWWQTPGTEEAPRSYIPKERLHTEIELEARAKASGQPRLFIERALPPGVFAGHWVRAFINSRLKTTTPLLRDYWFGFWEGVKAYDFRHKFNLTDDAHEKWLAGARSMNLDLVYVSRGYTDGLAGKPNPPLIFQVCQDDNLDAWQLLKCAVKGM